MAIPSDPLLALQWHLNNTTPGLLDLNVLGVWNPAEGASYTGAGVRTVIIDDGFDYTHSDFTNYDQGLDFDFEFDTLDPFGGSSESHGTAVSGIIGAAANGTGAVGVAFDTSMVGYRTAGFITDAWLQDIRDAIHHSAVSAQGDVVNISQGIANDTDSEFGVGYDAARFDEIETSINTAVDLGRGGLGLTIVKSAGNSRTANYDVNADDWTNDTRQVVVAAVDQNGFVSSYSSYGAAILVSGFGTPGEVFTTDRVGSAGYDITDFTSSFNGTSSAAPMVAGVVALMYEAAPELGWRDVQSILAASARQVGSEVGAGTAGSERYAWDFNDATNWNGGGMHFSNDYGYGLVDALAAVRLAETWLLGGQVAQVSTNEFTNVMDVLNVATVIPDGNATGLTFSGTAGFNDIVERVTVQMTFSTTFTADMEVYLISPDGTVSELIDDTGFTTDFNGTWTFETQAFRGQGAAGTWSVRVVDDTSFDVLSVSDIVITTFGAFTSNDRYVFTNEYSDYAGLFGHLTAITDTDGGVDTVNAAAVTSASNIRLDGTLGVIDGIAVSFANMEHAIGGDDADEVVGNGANNSLHGMRGNDTLDGGSGIDTLVGYVGNDTYITDGLDTITENLNEGTDTVRSSASLALGANLENLVLTGTDNIDGTGNDLANRLTGASGNNSLNGGLGNDTMLGGAGDDTYLVDATGDRVFETTTTVSSVDAGGIDTVQSVVTFNLDAYAGVRFVENLVLTGAGNINGMGNALANRLTGNAGNNVLNGGLGNDTMLGGAGDDTYVVGAIGDRVFETTSTVSAVDAGGIDTAKSVVTFNLDAYAGVRFVENLDLTGTANINGMGNALANRLTGNAGNNVLNGGLGDDTMLGGAGDDTFIVNDVNDRVFETTTTISGIDAGGIDTVLSSLYFNLDANAGVRFVENLDLRGTANINGIGNALANMLTGNAGNNVLNGGLGNDTMLGGAGDDTFIVDDVNDRVFETTTASSGIDAGGIDTVKSSVGVNLDATVGLRFVERLTLTGSGNINGLGNGLANLLTGNTGNNVLNGGLGNDTMTGGAGSDTFVFNTAIGAGNIDRITDFSAVDDTIRLDDAVFTGLATGMLFATAFESNLTGLATDALDRIIYDTSTGRLYYDIDGVGGVARVQFATLTVGSVLTNSDFFVF